MNRVLSLLLLVLVLFYSIGFYFVYQQNLQAVKKEMRLAIASKQFLPNQLVFISVPLSGNSSGDDFEINEENEISWKGNMYDLVSVKKEAGKTIYTCLRDDKETEIIDSFTQMLSSQTDQSSAGKKNLSTVKFSLPLFILQDKFMLKAPLLDPALKYFAIKDNLISLYVKSIPLPPPRS